MNHEITIDPHYKNSYVIYTRKSTDDAHNQKNSIDYQVIEGKTFATKMVLPVAEITVPGFCDHGIIKERHSGYKQDKNFEILENSKISQKVERPKFLMLISLLQRKAIKGVICLCWDRISRNENDDVLIKKLIKAGIEFKFIQVTYDNTSAGALHMDIDGMFSRHYSRQISEKVTNTLRKLRMEGKCTNRAPIGYINQGSSNKLLNPKTAPLVKMLFEMYETGNWGFIPLAKWANENGLTCDPKRRRRTNEEILNDVPMESIPKLTRPITKRGIEEILKNQFYIGKIRHNGVYISGIHQPLIDTNLFFRVQSVMNNKSTLKHKPYFGFFTYRGLIKCSYCKRVYSPYQRKGINYMRTACKLDCTNQSANIRESHVTTKLQQLLDQLHLTEHEIEGIGKLSESELSKINDNRLLQLKTTHLRLEKAKEDLDFLSKEKLSFIRNGIMSIDEIKSEEIRLNHDIYIFQKIVSENSETIHQMLDYIISFSKLLKTLSQYFQFALDSEKQEITNQIFSELYYSHEGLKYQAKEGFAFLFERNSKKNDPYCWSYYLFSELLKIYPILKRNRNEIERLSHTK